MPTVIICHLCDGARWPSGTVPDFAIARLRVRIPPTAAVYQRQLTVPSLRGSVNEYQRKLGNKRAYHAMH